MFVEEVDLGIQSKIDNFEMTERARAEDIARNKDRPESDKIGQPVGAWRYGKHQVHPGKTKRETETATDDVVAARFKRYITKR